MKLEFARSLSGHDKNHVYLIQSRAGDMAHLVNGTTHPLEKPKKKNCRHFQVIKKLPEDVIEVIGEFYDNFDTTFDSELKYHEDSKENHSNIEEAAEFGNENAVNQRIQKAIQLYCAHTDADN